jgi:hypothetical protein
MLIGARDSGSDAIASLLLSQRGTCGGAFRVFDDDSRYMNGLPAATARFLRRGANASAGRHARRASHRSNRSNARAHACKRVVDTTNYLHARWAPMRIHASMRHEREQVSLSRSGQRRPSHLSALTTRALRRCALWSCCATPSTARCATGGRSRQRTTAR